MILFELFKVELKVFFINFVVVLIVFGGVVFYFFFYLLFYVKQIFCEQIVFVVNFD